MKEHIWRQIEEAVAHAIATLAVEAIQTGVVIAARKLKSLREQEEGASTDAPLITC